MEKIINVKVSGSEIEQSTNFGGIQGEGGARRLKISFDEEWSGYSKSITFLDANLENPVKILLTTNNLDVDGTYLIAIPLTPLLTGGKFTYIIEGYADGILQRSVSKELKVKYAPSVDAEDLEGVITPTEADQLNLSIQNEAERIDALSIRADALEGEMTSLSENLDAQLLSKADTSYVEDGLMLKADKSYVDVELSAKADTKDVEEALSAKANTEDVEDALIAKANTSYVAEELLKKADKKSVAEELSEKADTSYVEGALDKKADKTDVEDAISDLDTRLTNQEEYIEEKIDEILVRNDVFASAIKGKASGAVVGVDDVSPIEHELTVKVRSENLLDVDTVTLTRCGANLFDCLNTPNYRKYMGNDDSIILDRTENSITVKKASEFDFEFAQFALPDNLIGQKITVYAEWTSSGNNEGFIRVNWDSELGGADIIASSSESGVSASGIVTDKPSDATHLALLLYSAFGSSGVEGDEVYYKNIMVNIGDKTLKFEPYKGQDYTPNADGTVEGVTSLAPTMTLMTDKNGVIIEAEYNKDTNKVIEELTNAIISLGGNI